MKQTNSRNTVKRDQLIAEQRKKLEELRLQSESENTKLLKIQQKQREVESEYQSKKKDMHETLSTLAQQAEEFLREQDTTTKQFDDQKDQIYSNDRKIKLYEEQQRNTQERNSEKRDVIHDKKIILERKTLELNRLRSNINDYRIYHDFLKDLQQLSEEFTPGDADEQGVNQIIKRYESLESKRTELIQQHHRIQQIKDEKIKRIQELRSENSNKILTYTSQIKEHKERIDKLNEENVSLESEIEGKLNENNERQTEIGQIIFSIRNLYECIVGSDKPQRSILDMLETISEQKKKLRDYMDLYQKLDERKPK